MLQNTKSVHMVYELPEDVKDLSPKDRKIFLLMLKIIPQLPDKSLKLENLENHILNDFRRIVERLRE